MDDDKQLNELDMLKARAEDMGIVFRANIGVEALKKKIEDKMSGNTPDEPEEAPAEKMSKEAAEAAKRKNIRDAKMKLRRVQIYNLNPQKADLEGEIITVANKYIGNLRKFIPYGEASEGGYHIEQALYDHLKARKFQQIRMKKDKHNTQTPELRMVPEFNIVDLPQLTQEELNELKLSQAAADRAGV